MSTYIPKYMYLDVAEKLSIGESVYIPHEGCTDKNKMWVTNGRKFYSAYCNKCGAKGNYRKGIQHVSKLKLAQKREIFHTKDCVELPEDMSYDMEKWPSEAKLWLYKADIRNFQIKKYGIGYSKQLHRVVIPVYNESKSLIMWQGRGLTEDQTKYLNLAGTQRNSSFFKSWVSKEKIHTYNKEIVVLVEDALSVIKVGRIAPCVAALGTSLSTAQLHFLAQFDNVYVWLDEDRGGLVGSWKALSRISLFTNVKRIRTEKDPKKYSYAEIADILSIKNMFKEKK